MKLFLVVFLAICTVQLIQAKKNPIQQATVATVPPRPTQPPGSGGGGAGIVGPGVPSCPIDLKRLNVKCAFQVFCTSHGECGTDDEYQICCPWNCAQRCINPDSPEYAAGYAALAELDGKK